MARWKSEDMVTSLHASGWSWSIHYPLDAPMNKNSSSHHQSPKFQQSPKFVFTRFYYRIARYAEDRQRCFRRNFGMYQGRTLHIGPNACKMRYHIETARRKQANIGKDQAGIRCVSPYPFSFSLRYRSEFFSLCQIRVSFCPGHQRKSRSSSNASHI